MTATRLSGFTDFDAACVVDVFCLLLMGPGGYIVE